MGWMPGLPNDMDEYQSLRERVISEGQNGNGAARVAWHSIKRLCVIQMLREGVTWGKHVASLPDRLKSVEMTNVDTLSLPENDVNAALVRLFEQLVDPFIDTAISEGYVFDWKDHPDLVQYIANPGQDDAE